MTKHKRREETVTISKEALEQVLKAAGYTMHKAKSGVVMFTRAGMYPTCTNCGKEIWDEYLIGECKDDPEHPMPVVFYNEGAGSRIEREYRVHLACWIPYQDALSERASREPMEEIKKAGV